MIQLVFELAPSGHPDNRRIARVALHGFGGYRSTAFQLAGRRAGNARKGVKARTDDELRSRARAIAPTR